MTSTKDTTIRVQFPSSGVSYSFISQDERDRSLQLAVARQQIAHEGTFLPTWQELTDDERATSEVAARNYLRAAVRAGLLPERTPGREISPDAPRWGVPVDLAQLLEAGGSVTLSFDPGESGSMTPDGDVANEPIAESFTADAFDAEHRRVGVGGSTESPEAALADLKGPYKHEDVPPGYFSEEPPF